jgi:hypothetical protein
MSHTNDMTHYMESFIKHICPICKLCDSKFPAFCMTIYGGNPARFFEMIRYVNVLRAAEQIDKIAAIYSFEGFTGFFCNSQTPCPIRSTKCKELESAYRCYDSFANQCGALLDARIKADVWAEFSGIETNMIGKEFRLPTTNPLKLVSKRHRRRIKRDIKRSKVRMRANLQQTTETKKKAPIKTTFFHNDNEEWERMIDSYLNSETNNRQSTTAT